MAERQPEVLQIIGIDDVEGFDRRPQIAPAVLDQPDTLGPTGGPGGVDQGDQIIRSQRGDRLVDELGCSARYAAPRVRKIRPADHRLTADRSVDLDDRGQPGQFVPMLEHLGRLGLVLGEDDLALGVGQDEGDVGVLGGRVDRRRGAAGADDGEIGQDPLDPGAGRDRHAIFLGDAERQQTGRQLESLVLGLRPGQRDPAFTLEIAKGLLVGRSGYLLEQHARDRRRTRRQLCRLRHRAKVNRPEHPRSGLDSCASPAAVDHSPRTRPMRSFTIWFEPTQISATRASARPGHPMFVRLAVVDPQLPAAVEDLVLRLGRDHFALAASAGVELMPDEGPAGRRRRTPG